EINLDILIIIFKNKSCNFEKLIEFGFIKNDNMYSYETTLKSSGFKMNVHITETGKTSAEVLDTDLNEPYTLHLASGAVGEFVGNIKAEYEAVLTEIAESCFEPDVFKTNLAKEIISYIRNTYGDELEYLWEKFPDNAVVRRSDNKKWYAAILTVSRSKLGFESDEKVEVIDLRMKPEEVEKIDKVKILPGYHMNKKHWITVVLDGTVPIEEIINLIDKSYVLAKK
ncbi:MAG: MmcQ/YjbR family DNA-binding protein, partial [Eubacterium sp.]|nr:MmcQ/YjbR family DNA-binding protein [Eubacterium sp.]